MLLKTIEKQISSDGYRSFSCQSQFAGVFETRNPHQGNSSNLEEKQMRI